jgi:hypothetical protein
MEIETYVVYWIASKISKTKQNKIQCNFYFSKIIKSTNIVETKNRIVST